MRENHQGTYQCIDENGGEFTSEKEGFKNGTTYKSTRIFSRSVQTDKNGNDPSFLRYFHCSKNGRRDLRRILQRGEPPGEGKRIWLVCWIKIRLKKSDEIILEKAYMGNFQIPNLAMSAKSLQKTVEPNHEGNGQKWPLVILGIRCSDRKYTVLEIDSNCHFEYGLKSSKLDGLFEKCSWYILKV